MSKTTVKKAVSAFDAGQLRQLLLEIYSKSKEAKELLDFYAQPDVQGLLDRHKEKAIKEINRRRRSAPAPRLVKLRQVHKHFSMFEPGAPAEADLRCSVFIWLMEAYGAHLHSLNDTTVNGLVKLLAELLQFLAQHALLSEWYWPLLQSIRNTPGADRRAVAVKNILAANFADYDTPVQ